MNTTTFQIIVVAIGAVSVGLALGTVFGAELTSRIYLTTMLRTYGNEKWDTFRKELMKLSMHDILFFPTNENQKGDTNVP